MKKNKLACNRAAFARFTVYSLAALLNDQHCFKDASRNGRTVVVTAKGMALSKLSRCNRINKLF